MLILGSATAIPKPDEPHHNSDHLAHTNHLTNPHDNQYDHEQFLGDQAKTFDQLAPEESQRRLG